MQDPTDIPPNWIDLTWVGDDWFIAYAYAIPGTSSVTLFALAHAVELYLKGCIAKHEYTKLKNGNGLPAKENDLLHKKSVSIAVGYQHNLRGMWDKLKETDSTFMAGFEISDPAYTHAFEKSDIKIKEVLTPEQWASYDQHRELYLVSKYAMDLKYLGGPLKKPMHPYLSHKIRNPYWIDFFKAIRNWIRGGDDGKYGDKIRNFLSLAPERDVPVSVVEYLKLLDVSPSAIHGEYVKEMEKLILDEFSRNE